MSHNDDCSHNESLQKSNLYPEGNTIFLPIISFISRVIRLSLLQEKIAVSKPPSVFLYENLFVYKVFQQMLTDFRGQ